MAAATAMAVATVMAVAMAAVTGVAGGPGTAVEPGMLVGEEVTEDKAAQRAEAVPAMAAMHLGGLAANPQRSLPAVHAMPIVERTVHH